MIRGSSSSPVGEPVWGQAEYSEAIGPPSVQSDKPRPIHFLAKDAKDTTACFGTFASFARQPEGAGV